MQINLFVLGILLLSFTACQTSKIDEAPQGPSIFEDDYYISNASNNVERLKLLTSGCYVYYNKNTVNNTFSTWLVNETDSILLYATPVGVAGKDGHWIYCHQYISSLPDEPLATYLVNYVQISRDSIKAVDYACPPVSVKDLASKKKLVDHFDFKKLDKGVEVLYVKTGPAAFEGKTAIFPNPKKNTKSFRKDTYQVSPKHNISLSDYFKDSEGTQFIRSNLKHAYFVRMESSKFPLFKTKE